MNGSVQDDLATYIGNLTINNEVVIVLLCKFTAALNIKLKANSLT